RSVEQPVPGWRRATGRRGGGKYNGAAPAGGCIQVEGGPMRRRLLVLVALAATMALATGGATLPVSATSSVQPAVPGTSLHFQLVGKNALYHRGMNAALAIYDHYVYVGYCTDSSNTFP